MPNLAVVDGLAPQSMQIPVALVDTRWSAFVLDRTAFLDEQRARLNLEDRAQLLGELWIVADEVNKWSEIHATDDTGPIPGAIPTPRAISVSNAPDQAVAQLTLPAGNADNAGKGSMNC